MEKKKTLIAGAIAGGEEATGKSQKLNSSRYRKKSIILIGWTTTVGWSMWIVHPLSETKRHMPHSDSKETLLSTNTSKALTVVIVNSTVLLKFYYGSYCHHFINISYQINCLIFLVILWLDLTWCISFLCTFQFIGPFSQNLTPKVFRGQFGPQVKFSGWNTVKEYSLKQTSIIIFISDHLNHSQSRKRCLNYQLWPNFTRKSFKLRYPINTRL